MTARLGTRQTAWSGGRKAAATKGRWAEARKGATLRVVRLYVAGDYREALCAIGGNWPIHSTFDSHCTTAYFYRTWTCTLDRKSVV